MVFPRPVKWTEKEIQNEANKHESRGVFRLKCPSAYSLAVKRGILDKVCSHMSKTKWDDDEKLFKEGLKYNTRVEFLRKSQSAYSLSAQRGILDKVCSHMKPLRTDWTYDMLKEEALRHNTRSDFQINSSSAYQVAFKKGILDEICSHMKKGLFGYDPLKPAILYYLKVKSDIYGYIFKIGVTNRSIEERFTKKERNLIEDYKEWKHTSGGQKILDREQAIIDKYNHFLISKKEYCPLDSGWTECFMWDVLGIWKKN